MSREDLSSKIDTDFHHNKLILDKHYENQLPTLTNKAKIFIQSELLPNQNLYVIIEGGGCHGLQYKFLMSSTYDYSSIQIFSKVFVDELSLEYMWGSVIDVSYDNEGKSLEITNPYAKQSCGCKVSFSV